MRESLCSEYPERHQVFQRSSNDLLIKPESIWNIIIFIFVVLIVSIFILLKFKVKSN